MSIKRQIRQENMKFDLTIPDNITEFYCDGITQMMFGFPICKLVFYTATAASEPAALEEQIEQRTVTFQLAMPTNALLDFANNIIASLGQNGVALSEGASAYTTMTTSNITAIADITKKS